jgi:hypothetical protein
MGIQADIDEACAVWAAMGKPRNAEQRAEIAGHIRAQYVRRLFYFCADDETLDQRRKEALQRREQMLSFQKSAGQAGDRDMARFFKDEAAEAMKDYRGACLVLGHLRTDLGDCPFRYHTDWPLEIVDHAVRMAAEALPPLPS